MTAPSVDRLAGARHVTRTGHPGRTRRPWRRSEHQGAAARHRRWWVPLLWVFPGLAATLAFSIFPFLNTFVLSFTNADPLQGGGTFVGLENYVALLRDSDFWAAAWNSVLYMLIATPLLVILPLLCALLVEKEIPWIAVFRTGLYVPVLTSAVVAGIAWQFLLRDAGLINQVLKTVGVIDGALPFLTDRWLLLLSCILVTVWKGLGWYMVLYLVALGNVDTSQHEAARLDGANALQRLLHVTVPAIRPMMLLVGTLASIGSLRVFAEIYMLGGASGGPGGSVRTLPFLIRDVGLDPVSGSAGYGAAISVALFVLSFVVALAGRLLVREDVTR